MAGMGRPIAGDGLSANIAGMSKTQLYDIMSQMKNLIEQNQQQARQILIQNPPLTKALFQAQIMLGMVQPPQPVQNIQPPPMQQSTLQTNVQAPQSLSGQVGKDQTGGPPPRMQHPNPPPPMATSTSIPGLNTHSQPTPLHPVQPQKGHLNVQVTAPVSIPQSSHHSSMQQPLQVHQPQQLQQQPLQTPSNPHMPLQPPLPPQPRPPTYQHQYPPHNAGFQHAGAPHHMQQLPPYHAGNKPPHMGPSFPPAQHLPSQPPPQTVYQPALMGNEFNNQVGSSMQVDRGSSWMPAPPENPTLTQHSAPPPLVPSQMGPSNPPARPQSLTPEMEKALLQQVMSLTPDQINLLPPEQRNQVLQLQQILRQ